jgi:hypothetical protein
MESVAVCSGALGRSSTQNTCRGLCRLLGLRRLPYARRFAGGKVEMLLWTPAAWRARSLFFPQLHRLLPEGSWPKDCHYC